MMIVFNPSDPIGTLRNLTNLGTPQITESILEKINPEIDGGQLI